MKTEHHWVRRCGVAVLAARSRAGAYEAVAVTDGGSLSGTVKYAGTPPAPAKFEVTKDSEVVRHGEDRPEAAWSARAAASRRSPVVVKASQGEGARGADRARHLRPEGLRVRAARAGLPGRQHGRRPQLRTASCTTSTCMGKENPEANRAMPKFQKKIDWKVEKAEWPIAVKCDAHPWMHAYWLVDGPALLRRHRRRRERSRSRTSRRATTRSRCGRASSARRPRRSPSRPRKTRRSIGR